jgi:lipopolysaccharide export LptBFGC system permease protein LptF
MLARQIAIGFGIAIVFPLLVYYGVCTFSSAPKWNDFHETAAVYTPNQTREELAARQEKQKAENAAWTEANRAFSLRLLCVAAPLGYIAIVLGSLRAASGLGSGFMFGGIFAVTIGYWFHWSFVEDWLRFVSLLIALAVLVFVAYRKFPSVGGDRTTA